MYCPLSEHLPFFLVDGFFLGPGGIHYRVELVHDILVPWFCMPTLELDNMAIADPASQEFPFHMLCVVSVFSLQWRCHRQIAITNFSRFSQFKGAPNTYKRQPSGTGGRKASQPKDQSNGKGSRATITSNGQVQSSIRHETIMPGTTSTKKGSQHIDSYDPARISQWAAQSAIGPSSMLENDFQGQCNLSCENNLPLSSAMPQIPGHFPVSQPACLDTLASSTSSPSFNHGMMDQDSMAGAHLTRFQVDPELSSIQGLDFPLAYDGQVYQNGLSDIDDHPFSPFVPSDFGTFPAVGADQSMFLGNDNTENPISSSWGTSCGDIMHPLDWSSTSGLTPSSSMQSSHSFLGHQAETPISTHMYDGIFGTTQDGPLENVNGVLPPYNLNNATAPQASINYADPERFVFNLRGITLLQSNKGFSTIRPNLNFQRAAIPLDMWTGHDGASQSYGLPMACSNFSGSRRSSEGEAKNARDHAFYKAIPEKDGLYHCPYTVSEKCSHKPDKLKCNYE